jgi:glutaredoxin
MKKILILSAITVLIATGCSLNAPKTEVIGIEEAKTKVVDFINNNLMQEGTEVSIKEITEDGDLYKVIVNMPNNQEIISYLTKDGKKFFPQVMDIAKIEGETKETATSNPAPAGDAPKTDKPVVELFVMAFCPYGVIAEDAMGPVFDLLGEKADINIRYIASMDGDDINQVKSLHGPIEGIEGARQLCVLKNYDKTTLWDYVRGINKDCYPIYRNGDDVYKECYTKSAKNAGIDIAKVNTCVEGEGSNLIKEQDEISKGYGVSGSPTLIINGTKINASRTPEGYKMAVCAAFNEEPEECSEALSSEGGSAGGC